MPGRKRPPGISLAVTDKERRDKLMKPGHEGGFAGTCLSPQQIKQKMAASEEQAKDSTIGPQDLQTARKDVVGMQRATNTLKTGK